MEPYVLLDVRGLVLRSLHSGTDRDAVTDSNGKSVNTPGHALDVFINNYLLDILKTHRAKQIIAVWDGGNEHRERICRVENLPEYKGTRKKERTPELDEAMKGAQAAIKDLLKGLGITQVVVSGVEADDVIAWLVQRLPNNIVIYTVDQDLMQLATEDGADRVVAINVGGKWPECYSDDRGNKVPYRWVALYKSMVGDSSDNYKGIEGFGPAAWEKLVEAYGYDNFHLIEGAATGDGLAYLRNVVEEEPGQHPMLEKILAQAGHWMTQWQLATLHPELVNSKDHERRKFRRPNWTVRVPSEARITALLEAHGCRHLVAPLSDFTPKQFILDGEGFDEESLLAEATRLFKESPFVSIDWETSAPPNPAFAEAAKGREVVDMLSSRITGAGFTFGRNLEHTFYATFRHADSNNLPIDLLPKLLACVPEDKPLIIQNVYFERTVYKAEFGLELPLAHDTKIMANHYEEYESSGLKDLSYRILNYKQTRYEDVVEKGKSMKDYSVHHVFQYGADDPLVTAHLYEFLKLNLLLEGSWDFVRNYEFPSVYQISDAYLGGINIDWNQLAELDAWDTKVYEESMEKLRGLIQANQTPELLEEGINNMMTFEREMLDAKNLPEDELKTSIANLRLNVSTRVLYVPYLRVKKEVQFKLTAKQLQNVVAYLDLPPFPDKLQKTSSLEWFKSVDQSGLKGDRAEFMRLVGENISTLHSSVDNPPPERRLLISLCESIVAEAMGDKAYEWTGSELSLNSPKQMQALLYGMLALPLRIRNFEVSEERQKLGLEGAPQANEDAILTAMAMDAPEGHWKREALECLMAAKKADTRRKNFYAAYPLWKHPVDGQIHAQLNTVGTETRRMSGSSPNLMQLPKRGEGIKVREILLPAPGHDLICSIDWAGEELRVAAGLSLDDEMLSCYIDAEVLKTLPEWMIEALGPERVEKFKGATLRDIHSLTASGIAKLPYDEFEAIRHNDEHPKQKEMKTIRGSAKSVNFLSQYGGGPTKLARKLICDPEIAKEYLSAKKRLYKGYEDWRTRMTEQLHEFGHLKTLYGSYRHVYDKLFTHDEGMRGYLERSALNSLIQGVCADYLKVVLTKLWEAKTFERHGAQFIAPIHDELVFSCHSSKAADLIMEVHGIMTQGIDGLPCPLWAEPSLGPTFGTQIEIGAHPNPQLINEAIGKAFSSKEAA